MFWIGVVSGWGMILAAIGLCALLPRVFAWDHGTDCLVDGCWLDIEAGSRINWRVWVAKQVHDQITRRRRWHQEAWKTSPFNSANWPKE